MNILYICADRGIPIRGHKGAAVHVRAMCAAFTRAGHRVTVVTPRPGPADGPAPQADIITIPLPPRSGDAPDENTARDWQSQAYRDVLFTAVHQIVQNHHYDFIYERYSLWSDVGGRLANANRLPLVLEVNAPLLEEAARYRSLSNYDLAAQIEAVQFKAAHAISAVSRPLQEYVMRQGAVGSKVHVLPNGVDPQAFYPAVRGGAVRGRYDLAGRFVIGFAGRARPWHDLPTLLQAVAQLHESDPRYHLLLVGQMPDDLTEQVQRLGLTQAVTATGPVPHDEIPEHLAAMDTAVSSHLALTDFYFSPLKLFEYLACGVPTVAADIGQPSTLIRDGETGLFYQPGDAASLAAKIRQMAADPAAARQMAWQGAVQVLQQHTWDQNAAAVVAWIRPLPPQSTPKNEETIDLPILDRKLRQRLYRATRPDLAVRFLGRSLPAFGKKGPARLRGIDQIEVLKYKTGRRCVLRYELDGRYRRSKRPAHDQVIGKVFRDDRGLRLHKLQKMLWHNGFGPNATDGITVPDSLAYIPEMRMQVQAYAPGETLNELAERTNIRPLIPLAARGLAKLHNLPVSIPANGDGPLEMKSYLLGDELMNLDRFTASLEADRPRAMPVVLALRHQLLAWAERLPTLPAAAPIHRDFYYSQLLFHNGELTLIDFDLFALGDPAIDVANFIAHLHFLGMDRLDSFYALAEEAELFLQEYGRYHPIDDSFRERLAFYKAATFFRLLNVVAPRPGLAHLFEPLLAHTTAALELV